MIFEKDTIIRVSNGKLAKIVSHVCGNCYLVKEIRTGREGYFQKINPNTKPFTPILGNEDIYFSTDGRKIVKVLNIKTGKSGVAKCHPDDTFSLPVGYKVAYEKLTDFRRKATSLSSEEELAKLLKVTKRLTKENEELRQKLASQQDTLAEIDKIRFLMDEANEVLEVTNILEVACEFDVNPLNFIGRIEILDTFVQKYYDRFLSI